MRSRENDTLGKRWAAVALGVGLVLTSGGPLGAAPRGPRGGETRMHDAPVQGIQGWLGTLWGWMQGAWEEVNVAAEEPRSPGNRSSSLDPAQEVTRSLRGDQGASIDPLGKY